MKDAAAMFGAACRFRDTKGLNQPTSKLENCSRRHEENTASGTDGHEADEPGAPASLPASQQARIQAGRDAGAPGAGVRWLADLDVKNAQNLRLLTSAAADGMNREPLPI